MPAHPVLVPVHTPATIDNYLVDEEFDMFEITTPCDGQAGMETLLCDDGAWDEFS